MSSPSSALAAPPRKGSTEPRLFTPPLRELTPDTSWGFECIDFLEKVLGWELLPWQKWLYVHALEKSAGAEDLPPDRAHTAGYRYSTIVTLVSRQNGKTEWLKGLGLWRLYVDGAKQVLISAQNLEFAENTLTQAVDAVKNNQLLNSEFEKFSQTNGKFRLVLSGGREWRAAVSTRRGGRSLSVDLALLDELREHQHWEAWNAIVPTRQPGRDRGWCAPPTLGMPPRWCCARCVTARFRRSSQTNCRHQDRTVRVVRPR